MKAISILLSLFPSFIHVFIRKYVFNQKIGKAIKIKFGTIILCNDLTIGDYTTIGPFSYLKGEKIQIGEKSKISALTIISSRINIIGSYVTIQFLSVVRSDNNKNSSFIIGDHSMIFPFCWLDTGRGIEIGSQTGIGGHTLIFTHGVWSNYLKGGPVSYGSVKIGDNVWLPWRVFIMPGVTMGNDIVVGANSLINKSVESESLIAGSPAKLIKKMHVNLSEEEKIIKLNEMLLAFKTYLHENNPTLKVNQITKGLIIDSTVISYDIADIKRSSDLFITLKKTDIKTISNFVNLESNEYFETEENNHVKKFISFLRGYGIRLYIN